MKQPSSSPETPDPAWDQADATHQPELIRAVYEELRRLASSYLGTDRARHTLQPTAIVHEAFLRLSKSAELEIQSRSHFFRVAAKSMRHVLSDYARSKNTEKRGGDWNRVTLSGIGTSGSTQEYDAADIHKALRSLENLSERQAEIVELRFFGGLKVEEIADLLNVSDRTVRNEWRAARAWLRSELNRLDEQ
ncbi:MAG: ECF-type sigma factor [Phycisphaerales bacterium JB052]